VNYYYFNGKERVGPFSLIEMMTLIKRGAISPLTGINREGDTEWKQLDSFPELQAIHSHKIGVRAAVIVAIIIAFGAVAVWKINRNAEETRLEALDQVRFERNLNEEAEAYRHISSTDQWMEYIQSLRDRINALREERESVTDPTKIAMIDKRIGQLEGQQSRLNLLAPKSLERNR
jgi:hypothetical protein